MKAGANWILIRSVTTVILYVAIKYMFRVFKVTLWLQIKMICNPRNNCIKQKHKLRRRSRNKEENRIPIENTLKRIL